MMAPKKDEHPVKIEVTFYPWKIGKIKFDEMTFQADFYMKLSWSDYRLSIPSNLTNRIALTEQEASMVWHPVVSFRNAAGSDGETFNPKTDRLKINFIDLFYVTRHAMSFHCNYDLSAFPMDTQHCAIEVQNGGADNKYVMELVDVTSVHQLYSNSFPPDFQKINMKSGSCTRKDGLAQFRSCVEFSFVLHRHLAYHLMLTYIPSALVVIMSWLSFWLGPQCTAPRVALGVTSLLTLATQFANVQRNLPPAAYVKSIDIWMFVCMFQVFGSLVEFTICNYKSQQRQNRLVDVKQVKPSGARNIKINSTNEDQYCNIDKAARILFPLSFALVNLIYWSYYLSV